MLAKLVLVSIFIAAEAALESVPEGFPAIWDGDKFYDYPMSPSSGIPDWLDGYFFGQTCASYGDQSNPDGEKLTHMFNAIGALVMFDINSKKSTFSGKYYPTAPYKIWDYYNRDFKASKIAWYGGASPFNITAMKAWSQFDNGYLQYPPNVDFWKIGTDILSATEVAVKPGLTFTVPELSEFRSFPFVEASAQFQTPGKPMIFLNMPVHERLEPDGSVYASAAVADVSQRERDGTQTMQQIIFRVFQNKTRIIEGIYSYGSVNDRTDCDPATGRFIGNEENLSGYMHSITSTTNYVILPVTSFLLDNCPQGPPDVRGHILYPKFTFINPLSTTVPLRFLIFSKADKQFVTSQPLRFSQPLFITHQWNAYEREDGVIVADMLGFTSNVYQFLVTKLVNQSYINSVPDTLAIRFYLNPTTGRVTHSNLLPGNSQLQLEFSQFNHEYEGKQYKYGYVVKDWYRAGNSIAKFDMDNPDLNPSLLWTPGPTVSVTEPVFVARPNAASEDDGVLIVKGIDKARNRGKLYIVDARSMQLIVEQEAPATIPFGFHNRYWSKKELGKTEQRREEESSDLMEQTKSALESVKSWFNNLG